MQYYLLIFTSLLVSVTAVGLWPISSHEPRRESYGDEMPGKSDVKQERRPDTRTVTEKLLCVPLKNRTSSRETKIFGDLTPDDRFPTLSNRTQAMSHKRISGTCVCTPGEYCSLQANLLISAPYPNAQPEGGQSDRSGSQIFRSTNYEVAACSVDRHLSPNITLILQTTYDSRGCCEDSFVYATLYDSDRASTEAYHCSSIRDDEVNDHQTTGRTERTDDEPWGTSNTIFIVVLACVVLASVLFYPIRSQRLKRLLRTSGECRYPEAAMGDPSATKLQLSRSDDDYNNNDTKFVTLFGTALWWLRRGVCQNRVTPTGNELEGP